MHREEHNLCTIFLYTHEFDQNGMFSVMQTLSFGGKVYILYAS